MPATNELPAFDESNAPITLSVLENTPAGENIGDPFTATDTRHRRYADLRPGRNRCRILRYR